MCSAAVPNKRGAASHCERAEHVQPLAVRFLQIHCRQRRGEPGLVRLRLLRGFVVRASWSQKLLPVQRQPHLPRPTTDTPFAGSGLSRHSPEVSTQWAQKSSRTSVVKLERGAFEVGEETATSCPPAYLVPLSISKRQRRVESLGGSTKPCVS